MKIGSLVLWQEPYADDPDMIRNAGMGILLSVDTRQSLLSEEKYKIFQVYRNKINDIITLSEEYVSLKE